MTATLTSEDFDELHEFVRLHVAAGFSPIEEIVDAAVDSLVDTATATGEVRNADSARAAALAVADQALAAHRANQAVWPEQTDCDRLDAAFAALEEAGILARQHYSCCATCGAEEIHEEIEVATAARRPARGFTFFHTQDTEQAIAGEWLYLSYGSATRDKDDAVAIGHEVVAVLSRHGLAPNWNGRVAHRIALPVLWQRRR